MANIEYFHDDCQTAADVMAKAHEVREKRRAAFSKPQVIYIREPAPEPEIKYIPIKPSIVEMTHAICDHYKIEQSDLMEIIEESRVSSTRRSIAEAHNIKMRTIQEAVCIVMGTNLADMLSARRGSTIVLPRHIAMFLCKKYLLKSLPEIGRAFGHRDHTSILFAIRKIERLSKTDLEIQKNIKDAEKLLGFGSIA